MKRYVPTQTLLGVILFLTLSVEGCVGRRIRLDHPLSDRVYDGLSLDDPSLDPFRIGGFVIGSWVTGDLLRESLEISVALYGNGDPSAVEVVGATMRVPEPLEIGITDVTYAPSVHPEDPLVGILHLGYLRDAPVVRIREAEWDPVLEVRIKLGEESRVLVYELVRVPDRFIYFTV